MKCEMMKEWLKAWQAWSCYFEVMLAEMLAPMPAKHLRERERDRAFLAPLPEEDDRAFPAAWHGWRWRDKMPHEYRLQETSERDVWVAIDPEGRVYEIVDKKPASLVRPYVGAYIYPQECVSCGPWMSDSNAPPGDGLCPGCAVG
jgi:hypothetical protein